MLPEFVSGSPFWATVWAGGILLASVLVAWLILVGMNRAQRRLEHQVRKATFTPQLLRSLSRPIFLLVVSQGLILVLSSLPYLASWRASLGKLSVVVTIALVTYGLTLIVGELLAWYLHSRTVQRRAYIDEGLVRFLRRLTVLLIYAIGVLILLDYLKIAITPIVAGLGIGGLAVALALQPTLGNFFASTQIVSDRLARIGDYIELDNGAIRGYVTDIGWRSTRIRTPYNNMVTIPNSRLADSVVTNFSSPSDEMGVMVTCGVSYSSDLTKVESVALAVAREVIQELDEAVKTFEPWFGYEEFGESNINFWVWLQAKDRLASFRVKSELIKRLKTRFDREGITINYPVRRIIYDSASGAPSPLSSNPADSEAKENG